MNPKTIKTAYWISTSIFALFALMDGIGGVTRQQAGVDAMQMLGYPVYFLTISGVAKLLGVAGILQTKYKTLKEWAYAGFAFQMLGAFASWSFAGGETFNIIFPLIMLAIMCVPYYFWKRYEQLKANSFFMPGSSITYLK